MKKIKKYELIQKQSLPLNAKIEMSKRRIRNFYEQTDGNVYVSFSGGKDSTVLLHLVRTIYPNTPAVFCDTGLEYPEIKEFVKTFDNVTIIRPEMGFKKVLETEGYPIISKDIALKLRKLQNPIPENKKTRHLYATGERNYGKDGEDSVFRLADKWQELFQIKYDKEIGYYSDFKDFKISEQCCNIMKKKPFHKYEKKTGLKPILGTMASDSRQRMFSYLQTGCNSFNKGDEKSRPLSFWLEKDIWDYIKKNNLSYASIYDKGIDRTGCIFCMFGVHMEKGQNRFQQLKKTHPRLYDYCINKLGLKKVLEYIDIPITSIDDWL